MVIKAEAMEGYKEKRERIVITEVIGFEAFRDSIKGWRTTSDGDFCGDCWGAYLQRFDENLQRQLKEEARPTKDYIKYRRLRDGWSVECERCSKLVVAKDKEDK